MYRVPPGEHPVDSMIKYPRRHEVGLLFVLGHRHLTVPQPSSFVVGLFKVIFPPGDVSEKLLLFVGTWRGFVLDCSVQQPGIFSLNSSTVKTLTIFCI